MLSMTGSNIASSSYPPRLDLEVLKGGNNTFFACAVVGKRELNRGMLLEAATTHVQQVGNSYGRYETIICSRTLDLYIDFNGRKGWIGDHWAALPNAI
jgi:hypothetical protein